MKKTVAAIRQYGYGCSADPDLKDDKRQAKWEKQRESRGFDDSETWSLDCTFARFIVPRLKRFKKLNNGHPPEMTMKEWEEIIQKMIDGFSFLDSEKRWCCEDSDFAIVDEAAALFSKWLIHLWW
jgi:hypothetical protein